MNPKLRDVHIQPTMHQGQQGLLLADPLGISKRALFVPNILAPLLPLMDGSRDLGTLRIGFELRTGIPISLGVLENLISQMDASTFLDNNHYVEALKVATENYRQATSRPPIMAGRSCPGDRQELASFLQEYMDEAQIKRAQGEVTAGGLGVSPDSNNSLESLFDKEGLREFGDRGLKAGHEMPSDGAADQPARASGDIKGIISPHIDFPRGGPVYGGVWAAAAPAVKEAELVIILGTDHNGGNGEITLTQQSYETPWGIVPTDQEAVNRIAALAGEDAVFGGELRHRGEHSVEAALIWLHYLTRDKPRHVVPILCGSFELFIHQNTSPSECKSISAAIEALREIVIKRRTVIVAAADLAHVGPAFGDRFPLNPAACARLEARDQKLLEIMRSADAGAFFEEIRSEGDQRRICGLPPIYVALSVLSGVAGSVIGYSQCPASEDGTSIVSICGMVYRPAHYQTHQRPA